MKRIFYILSMTVFMLWGVPSSAADLSGYNYLQSVENHSSENEIKIALSFSKPVEGILEPRFFEKSIQFTFNKTYVKPSKQTLNLEEQLITDVHVYQYDKNNVRIRLVTGKGETLHKDRLIYEKNGNQLLISILKENIDLANNTFDENLSLPVADIEEDYNKPAELLTETIYREDLIPLTYDETDESKISLNLNKDEKNFAASNNDAPSLFASSIKVATALMIVLSLMMIVYYLVKKYLLKDGSLLGTDKPVRVLSTSYIAPKKTINLVEVAGEILVLGVTSTNINLLTKIDDKETIEKIKGKKEGQLTNWKRNKKIKSSFSKHLDACTSKPNEKKKKESSATLINRLIEEKINKVKMV